MLPDAWASLPFPAEAIRCPCVRAPAPVALPPASSRVGEWLSPGISQGKSHVHAKRHAMLARLLIEACDGLEAAADACRLKTSQLQRFCDTRHKQFMPADVIDDLESKCGRRIYSSALFDGRSTDEGEDLVVEACELSEITLSLQRIARLAKADGRIDAREQNTLGRLLEEIGQQFGKVQAANARGRT